MKCEIPKCPYQAQKGGRYCPYHPATLYCQVLDCKEHPIPWAVTEGYTWTFCSKHDDEYRRSGAIGAALWLAWRVA